MFLYRQMLTLTIDGSYTVIEYRLSYRFGMSWKRIDCVMHRQVFKQCTHNLTVLYQHSRVHCHCLYMQFKHNFTFTFTTFVGLNEHNVYMCLKHKILCYAKKEILCEMSPNANIRKKCSDTNYKDEEKHTTNDNYIRILYMGSCYLKYIVSRQSAGNNRTSK